MDKEELDKHKPPLVINSEEEFVSLIEDIDREMVVEQIPITARPFTAGIKITSRYDVILNAIPPDRPPKCNCFDALEISIRIHNWMQDRYGEKLKVSFQIGKVVLPLRGDLYLINCPVIYGKIIFVCEPQTFGQKREKIGINASPIVNILDSINNLTPALAESLNAEEVIKISVAFVLGMGAYTALEAIKDIEFIREVIGDFDASVAHLLTPNPQAGLSKWASLQVVEKLYKAYISQKGEFIIRTHSLQKLCKHAEQLGLPSPPQDYIDFVQCPAGVRYGEISVSLEESLKAHLVSLEICGFVAQHIGKVLNRKMPVIPEMQMDGMPFSQFCKKYNI